MQNLKESSTTTVFQNLKNFNLWDLRLMINQCHFKWLMKASMVFLKRINLITGLWVSFRRYMKLTSMMTLFKGFAIFLLRWLMLSFKSSSKFNRTHSYKMRCSNLSNNLQRRVRGKHSHRHPNLECRQKCSKNVLRKMIGFQSSLINA